jgi:transcriptional regulator GlxA family with amidase domain
LLAQGKLLDNQRATTHWAIIEQMRQDYPQVEVLSNARIVDEGHIVTSAGISAGIDMSFHVVARLYGREIAEWTARHMEYNWP